MKNKISEIVSILLLLIVLTACGTSQAEENTSDVIEVFLDGKTATSECNDIKISEGLVEITQAGSYIFEGEYEGQIHVVTEDDGQVQLILAGVSIKNSETAPIYIETANEAVITIMKGTENSIQDLAAYLEDEVDALGVERTNGAIYSKEDLIINGSGSLTITTIDKTGILAKDELMIYDVSLNVDAARNGIKGKDLVYISGAKLDVQAQEKGVQSDVLIDVISGDIRVMSVDDSIHSNDSVIIQSGSLSLNTEDDGIHADVLLEINGGKITVEDSYEGLEAKDIIINGGEITLNASDDGINATDGTSETFGRGAMAEGGEYEYGVHIKEGTLTINSYGDGLDSNGNVWMSGGTVIVSGPVDNGNGSIDYSGTFEMTGGDLVATGSSGMLQAPSESSTIPTIVIGFDTNLTEDSHIQVADTNGNILLDISPQKSFDSLVYSSIDLEIGASYNVLIDDEVYVTMELTDLITREGDIGGMGGMRQKGMGPDGIHSKDEIPKEMPAQ